jgi:Protein of unknown function (DUF2397)
MTATVTVTVTDFRRAMAYLIAPEADDYIAIMAVLEASITDLTPAEVASALRKAGTPLDARTVDVRLEQLRDWTAASARTDTSRILRYADPMARHWRYTATRLVGRCSGSWQRCSPVPRRCGRSRCRVSTGSSHPSSISPLT